MQVKDIIHGQEKIISVLCNENVQTEKWFSIWFWREMLSTSNPVSIDAQS